MPSYTFTSRETGQKITLTGDIPPSQSQVDGAFSLVSKKSDATIKASAEMMPAHEAAVPEPDIKQKAMEFAKAQQEFITGEMPDNPILSKEYLTDNIPRSVVRFPAAATVGAGHLLYDAAAKFTDPVAKAISGEQGVGQSARDLLHAPIDAIKGVATSVLTPTAEAVGLYGTDRMKKAWNDPAAAAAAVAPIVTGSVEIAPTWEGVKKATPFTELNTKAAAGKVLNENYQNADMTPEQVAANLERTQGLTERTGAEFTPAQQTGSLPARKFEQKRSVSGTTGAEDLFGQLEGQESTGSKLAQKRAIGALGEGNSTTADLLPMDALGQKFHNSISKEKSWVAARKAELFSEIPVDYGGNFSPFLQSLSELNDTSKTTLQDSALQRITGKAKELMPNGQATIKDAMVMWEEINDAANSPKVQESKSAMAYVMSVKDALDKNLDAFGEKAMGQFEKDGRLFDKGELESRLENNHARINDIKNTPGPLDTEAMVRELRQNKNAPPTGRDRGESAGSWAERIANDYQKVTGFDPLRETNLAGEREIAKLETDNATTLKTLGDLAPAVNASVRFRIARNFAANEFHKRFSGTANRVLSRGNQSLLGTNLPAETIPRQYDSLQGALDLRREVGQKKATELMSEYYQHELETKFTDKNGLFNPSNALQWAEGKENILSRYGLNDTVKEALKAKVPDYFKSKIEMKGTDMRTQEPRLTAMQVKQLIQENKKVLDLFGEDAVSAWKDYLDVVSTYDRNKVVSYAKGPNTAEKMTVQKALMSLTDIAAGTVTGAMVGGGYGGATGVVTATIVKGLREARQKAIDSVINESIINETLRRDVMELAKPTSRQAKFDAVGHITNFISKTLVGGERMQKVQQFNAMREIESEKARAIRQ